MPTVRDEKHRVDDLTDEEIDSWGISDAPYVHCYDVPAGTGCCFECHDAERDGRSNLTVVEKLGRRQVKTWLCCLHRTYWHALDMSEKLELISHAEANPNRPQRSVEHTS